MSASDIDDLARAARAGDRQALSTLGLRLLTGNDAPSLPIQGAALILEAAGKGEPRAAETAAVLAGGGFFTAQDWSGALDWLLVAAEAGSASARDQLQLLSGGSGEDWPGLRAAVDLAAWTAATPTDVLHQEPLVRRAPGLLAPEACDWIVAQARGRLVRTEVHDPRTGLTIMGKRRTNSQANFTLAETSLLNMMVQAKIAAACGAPMAMMESFAVLHYGVGEEASEHFDYLDPSVPAYAAEISRLGQRVATCLLYLNEDYEGGETAFPELGLRCQGRKGEALIFFSVDRQGRPDPRSVHAGRPPTAGEKWVLSQFIRNRPVVPGAG